MKDIRIAFIAFCTVSAIAGISYALRMYTAGNFDISSENQDWGSFGSYLGGIIAPAASLLAAYMIYKGLSSSAHQQKLTLARESLTRLDEQLEIKLQQPLYNSCHGDNYFGQSLRDVIYDLSNKDIYANERSERAFLALLHNIAILTHSIGYYMDLLREIPAANKDNDWLGDLERSYWIEKYSAICTRLIKIVGKNAFENKISKEQLKSFEIVMRGEQRL